MGQYHQIANPLALWGLLSTCVPATGSISRNPRPHPVVLFGSPMGAAGFITLPGLFPPPHTTVRYDPRGVERSGDP